MGRIPRFALPFVFLLALTAPAAHADTVAQLSSGCVVRDASDDDPGTGGNSLPYRFCDDGLPPTGGRVPNLTGAAALTVPQKYNGFAGLPTAAAADPGTGADASGNIALDADLSVPSTGSGWPLVVMMHGCCAGDKASWESPTIEGNGGNGETWHYSNSWFASRGYAVLNLTSRGFVNGQNRGSTGETQLDSRRYEINDYQHLACQIAATADLDPSRGGNQAIDPAKVVPTGGSYGGGFTWMAYTDPAWNCAAAGAGGIDMSVVTAATKYGWTDLVQSLVPNGNETSVALPPNNPASAFSSTPLGFPKRTIVAALFGSGAVGVPPGNHTTFPQSIVNAFACLESPDARDPAENPACTSTVPATVPNTLQEFIDDRSAYYQTSFFTGLGNGTVAPRPLFSAGTLTDPLFPPAEHRRMVERLKTTYTGGAFPVQEYYGDYNHFVQNKPREWGDVCGSDRHVCTFADYGGTAAGLNSSPAGLAREIGATTRLNRFLDHYAQPGANAAEPQPAFDVTASLQTCPDNAAINGVPANEPGPRFTDSTFAGLAPNLLAVVAPGTAVTTNDVEPNPHALNADPVANTASNGSKCAVETGRAGVGIATYESDALPKDVTMLGQSRIAVAYTATGTGKQLNTRMYDLFPDGKAVLVDRGVKRVADAETGGALFFELHGNGWRFAAGHRIRVELTQDDDPYIKNSSQPSSFTLLGMQLGLPIRESSFSIAGGVPGGGEGAAAGGNQAAPDKTPPRLRLKISRRQRVLRQKAIVLKATSDEPAVLRAIARMSVTKVRSSRTAVKTKAVTRRLTKAGTATLRLRLSKKALKTIRAAVRRKKYPTATVSVSAVDISGNTKRARVRLKVKR